MEQTGGVIKMISMPLWSISDLMKKEQKGGAKTTTSTTLSYDNLLSFVASMIFMILAGYLCWKCNVGEDRLLRILYTILAVIFNGFYLIYYFIYRVLMGNACKVATTVTGM